MIACCVGGRDARRGHRTDVLRPLSGQARGARLREELTPALREREASKLASLRDEAWSRHRERTGGPDRSSELFGREPDQAVAEDAPQADRHRHLARHDDHGNARPVGRQVLETAIAVEDLLQNDATRTELVHAARQMVDHPAGRLAFIGVRGATATAQFAALVVKESAKVVAEGYTSGQFRHGPFELAEEGLTAVLFFPNDDPADPSLHRLCTDLVQTGSRVIAVGSDSAEATVTIPLTMTSPLAAAAGGAVVVELFAVELARANQVEPRNVHLRQQDHNNDVKAMADDARAPSGGTTSIVVGVDIGGTGTRFVVASTAGVVLDRLTIETPHGRHDDAVGMLRDQLWRVASGRRPAAVGVGASGPIDADGVIRNPDTLPAFTGLSLTEELAPVAAGRVVVVNDAVCAAVAERRVGAAQHARRSLHITLGTGIGVCLLEGDSPYRLPDGSHPEAGHIAVTSEPAPCYCGRSACWEQIASRRRLQATAARLLDRPDTDRSAIAELADHASTGDDAAIAAFDDYGVAVASSPARVSVRERRKRGR